jgi:protein-S-isoprenylcysteine O-methyltransferase Ste14
MPHIPPPVIALAAGVVQHLVARGGPPGPARKVAAGAVAAGSVTLLAGSAYEFGRHKTTVNPFDPSQASALVTTGPNRVTRNPMYVGMAGLLTAHAALRGSWLGAVPVAAFVAIIDRVQIAPEEQAMRELFGEEYDDYCRSVPRWLGVPG